MKSKVISYGKLAIFIITGTYLFVTIISIMPFVDSTIGNIIFSGFKIFTGTIGAIVGLTIGRYAARETAQSARGNYPVKKEESDEKN